MFPPRSSSSGIIPLRQYHPFPKRLPHHFKIPKVLHPPHHSPTPHITYHILPNSTFPQSSSFTQPIKTTPVDPQPLLTLHSPSARQSHPLPPLHYPNFPQSLLIFSSILLHLFHSLTTIATFQSPNRHHSPSFPNLLPPPTSPPP